VVPDSCEYAFAIALLCSFSYIYTMSEDCDILPKDWMNFEREKAANSGRFFSGF